MSDYKIKLEIFEGPLDLLMHLIEKNQIDIYDIPIAVITEQYIGYLKALEEYNIDIASSFLLMAATLLQIKSRMLLPRPSQLVELTEEEDPRQELVDRLLEYRKFKDMSVMMGELLRQREHFFTRLPEEIPVRVPLPLGLNINDLVASFAAVWESSIDDYELVSREEFSIQDKMYDIIHLLYRYKGKIEFHQTLIRKGTRSEVVAAFLALLELVKLQRVIVSQQERFSTIYITLKE